MPRNVFEITDDDESADDAQFAAAFDGPESRDLPAPDGPVALAGEPARAPVSDGRTQLHRAGVLPLPEAADAADPADLYDPLAGDEPSGPAVEPEPIRDPRPPRRRARSDAARRSTDRADERPRPEGPARQRPAGEPLSGRARAAAVRARARAADRVDRVRERADDRRERAGARPAPTEPHRRRLLAILAIAAVLLLLAVSVLGGGDSDQGGQHDRSEQLAREHAEQRAQRRERRAERRRAQARRRAAARRRARAAAARRARGQQPRPRVIVHGVVTVPRPAPAIPLRVPRAQPPVLPAPTPRFTPLPPRRPVVGGEFTFER